MKKRIILSTFLYFSIISLQNTIAQDSQKEAQVQTQEKNVLSLKEIDKLIKNKDYNKALKEISIYMKAYPKDFDRAQKRVHFIMNTRDLFDTRAEKLADAMVNDGADKKDYSSADVSNYTAKERANDQEKVDLIVQLENQEINHTKTAEELIRQARKALALRFYIAQYNRIMEEGYRLVVAEKYDNAITKFQEGFHLKPNDSDKIYNLEYPDGLPVTYAEDITVPVEIYLKNITNLLPEFYSLRIDCQKAYEEFMSAVQRKDYNGAIVANTKVQHSFKNYADLRNRIQAEVSNLEKIDKIANERNPELKGFSYITFTLGFINGDSDFADTGVLGTLDSYWNSRIENMKNSIYDLTFSDLNTAKEILISEDIENSKTKKEQKDKWTLENDFKTKTSNSIRFSNFGSNIQNLNNEIITDDGKRLCQDFKEYIDSMDFIKNFSVTMNNTLEVQNLLSDENLKKYTQNIEDKNLQEISKSKESLDNHLNAVLKYEEITSKAQMDNYIEKEIVRENEYFKNKEIVLNQEKYSTLEVETALEKYQKPQKTAGAQLEDAVLDYREIIEYQQKIAKADLEKSKEKTIVLWSGLTTLLAKNSEENVEIFTNRYNNSENLLAGINDDSGILRRYPKEAKKEADNLISEIEMKHSDFIIWRTSLSKGEKYRNTIKEYDEGTKVIDKSIKDLENLISQSRKISSQAESQIKLSERAYAEAQQNYQRAVQALEVQNFTNAKNFLNIASQKYSESFNLQESINERLESDRLIEELSERIIREENELVIQEVRELINEAQDSYYDGNLDYAEKLLITAQSRWSVTNSEKNEEIESLLEIVSTARTLQIGRKLKITDPLYSDLSQLLSVANQFYEDGSNLMKQGKKTEAISVLNLAKEKLEPMKLIYPLNDEAALLRLKIEKVLDPEAFNAGFKRKVDEANRMKQAERLASLQTLLKINPNYPGLAKQVEDLEYNLGVKTRPSVPTKAGQNAVVDENRKQAENLYNQAISIFNSAGNNQEELQRANTLLNEIIRLYSRDRRNSIFRQATALKDRIQSRIGGTVVAVLTADDEANFQRAQNFVNRGNYDAANDILEKLWTKPAARRTKKIIDLRTFVKNRL